MWCQGQGRKTRKQRCRRRRSRLRKERGKWAQKGEEEGSRAVILCTYVSMLLYYRSYSTTH